MARTQERRARAVCVRCHSRKVKCDLEARPGGICSRCQHENHQCQPHIGPRKQRAIRSSLARARTDTSSPDRPVVAAEAAEAEITPQEAASSFSVLGNQPPNCSIPVNGADVSRLPNFIEGSSAILDASQACRLPPPVIAQALSDFYFRELFCLVPVLDRGQPETTTSVLLQQALYFAGSTMRQAAQPSAEWSAFRIYGRIKTLLFLHHDPSPFHMLAALCILGTWLPYSPDAITLDNPWQWTSMGIRLGIQLHLHEDGAYRSFTRPGRMRRIWWYLFINDTLQMSCCGRPGMFPLKETTVRLPEATDFEDPHDLGAASFCALASLCTHLRKAIDLGRYQNTPQDQVYSGLEDLIMWRERLPVGLNLFDMETRKPYHRPTVELYVFYLVTVILTCSLGRRDNSPCLKYVSMVASSCISRLYEEVLYHEDVQYLLPIHSWANLVAAIPRAFSDSDILNPNRIHELEICQQVLEKMSEKHTSASMIRGKIDTLGNLGVSMFPQADDLSPIPDQRKRDMARLFPFPMEFCPMLDLLHWGKDGGQGLDDLPALSMNSMDGQDWPVDWSLFLFDAPMNF
ncbi:unnamed protein product [Penicillium salamii]|uniref:Zn(2)-C6 fungal-type domain-containing protein n=1 Tax=Penicillium salamii TaxID=1612424 RepID=A0A9W4NF55_9EURO|nr:unnamed protein product [Penicillium salamii]CAG8366053.1 unnamed protein product [Penicillium salamii]CAG8386906.1 unnamed protein product [Penicillium salamii]CAG8388873.1 unnamed protein product [Penicillium salamii]